MVDTQSGPNSSLTKIKLLCSYDGKIIPRRLDGGLRYIGGHSRLLSFPRLPTFSELQERVLELYGSNVRVKCKLPTDDLDALVTITCDEDLAIIIEEYDKFAPGAKIRVYLYPVKPRNQSRPRSECSPSLLQSGHLPPSRRYFFITATSMVRSTPPWVEKLTCHHHHRKINPKNSALIPSPFQTRNSSPLQIRNSRQWTRINTVGRQ